MTQDHSSGAPACAFELSSGQKEGHKCPSPGIASGSTNSGAVYLGDTICAIAHTHKLLHPAMQMTWLQRHVYHKDRMKIIPVSFPEYLLPKTGAN